MRLGTKLRLSAAQERTSRLSTYILYKLCHLSEPQFPHLSKGHNDSTDHTGLLEVQQVSL